MSNFKISIEQPTEAKLKVLNVFSCSIGKYSAFVRARNLGFSSNSREAEAELSWSIWTKEPSVFDWHYDEKEACYFLEGEVTVKTP